jgi:hypothetical protein
LARGSQPRRPLEPLRGGSSARSGQEAGSKSSHGERTDHGSRIDQGMGQPCAVVACRMWRRICSMDRCAEGKGTFRHVTGSSTARRPRVARKPQMLLSGRDRLPGRPGAAASGRPPFPGASRKFWSQTALNLVLRRLNPLLISAPAQGTAARAPSVFDNNSSAMGRAAFRARRSA